MSWDDDEYANGADGSCQQCGDPTDEPWDLYCRDCYAEQMGWARPQRPYPPDRDALAFQREERERVATTRIVARLDELERRVRELEGGDPHRLHQVIAGTAA